MFGKWTRNTGKGKSGIKSFYKQFEVASYVPVDYQDTLRWYNFGVNSERYFKKALSSLAVDDLCLDVFDQLIDSEAERNKRAIDRQRTNHIYTAVHDTGVLKGNIESAKEHVAYLEADRKQVRAEIEELKKRMEENN